jgi:hypothetical protein
VFFKGKLFHKIGHPPSAITIKIIRNILEFSYVIEYKYREVRKTYWLPYKDLLGQSIAVTSISITIHLQNIQKSKTHAPRYFAKFIYFWFLFVYSTSVAYTDTGSNYEQKT